MDNAPDFGPGGYLPSKAAKRARKIVLREQMGFGWPMAAIAAALLVGVAGVAFLRSSSQPPAAPFQAVGEIAAVEASGAGVLGTGAAKVLVVRAAGPVRVFAAEAATPIWCPETRRLESPDAAWTADGRSVFGSAPSLQPLRSVVFDGVLYVDLTPSLPRPAAGPPGARPACA